MATIKRAALSKKNYYLTSKGLEDLQNELNLLRKERRPDLIDRMKQTREFGDVSENSEYYITSQELEMVEARIEELDSILHHVMVITHSATETAVVSLGSTVKVKMDGKISEFTIVGKVEADPSQKRISNESPVGKALIGAKKGDELEISTPSTKFKAKVLEIK
jgi:transcription elongation factor GreA